MPATQLSKHFHPLCHEHHSPIEVSGRVVTSNGEERPSYACAEPDCLVHYSDAGGYFIAGQGRNADELDMVPKVECRQDGTLMYLDAREKGLSLVEMSAMPWNPDER